MSKKKRFALIFLPAMGGHLFRVQGLIGPKGVKFCFSKDDIDFKRLKNICTTH